MRASHGDEDGEHGKRSYPAGHGSAAGRHPVPVAFSYGGRGGGAPDHTKGVRPARREVTRDGLRSVVHPEVIATKLDLVKGLRHHNSGIPPASGSQRLRSTAWAQLAYGCEVLRVDLSEARKKWLQILKRIEGAPNPAFMHNCDMVKDYDLLEWPSWWVMKRRLRCQCSARAAHEDAVLQGAMRLPSAQFEPAMRQHWAMM
eukprot:GHVT01014415.1.p3 GENE.GHVT01014415.1~~GHVT01014415.1.p3  ORF type:complete len:201 (-),score=29.74 GHVT01014415.1:8802-9404(-)